MAAAGKTEEERRLAESGEQVEPVPAPMSPACGTFLQFVGTVNTLWGSDRVLRMGQFLGRYVHGAPEVSAEAEWRVAYFSTSMHVPDTRVAWQFGPEAQALGAIFGAGEMGPGCVACKRNSTPAPGTWHFCGKHDRPYACARARDCTRAFRPRTHAPTRAGLTHTCISARPARPNSRAQRDNAKKNLTSMPQHCSLQPSPLHKSHLRHTRWD